MREPETYGEIVADDFENFGSPFDPEWMDDDYS